jgi:hypothetical protein
LHSAHHCFYCFKRSVDEFTVKISDFYRIISRKWEFAISSNCLAVSEVLRTFSRNRYKSILCEEEPKARALFCCLAVREYGYTGNRTRSAGVSIAVQRGEEVLKRERSLRERIVKAKIIAS